MSFKQAQDFVAKWEGGLVNHPSDPGGLTNLGVSLRFLRGVGYDVDGDGDIDADDIRVLTPDGAADLLKQEFWTCQDLDNFPPITAVAHYDASVNCGRGRAVRLLQSACNQFPGPQIKEDGRLGPKTRARVAGLKDLQLAMVCVNLREDFYRKLVAKNSALSCFMKGWLRRSTDLSEYVSKIAMDETQPEKVRPDETQDTGLPATPAESAAYILPLERPGTINPQSPLVLPPLSNPVPAVPLAGFRLSKKLCVVIAGALVLMLNDPLHFGLSPQDSADMVKLLASYLIGQAGVDAFKPFASAILKAGTK